MTLIAARGGNPHHDERGRFSHGPGGPGGPEPEPGPESESENGVSGDASAVLAEANAKVKEARPHMEEGLQALLHSPTRPIDHYTGPGYEAMQKALYEGGPIPEEVADLDAVFEDPALSVRNLDQITLHRGMTGAEAELLIGQARPGDRVINDGFMSTAARQEQVPRFTEPQRGKVMEITVPPGATMVAGDSSVDELILPRGRELVFDGSAGSSEFVDAEVLSFTLVVEP